MYLPSEKCAHPSKCRNWRLLAAAVASVALIGPATRAADPFSIAVIPDTQNYSSNPAYAYHFHNETQWIVDHKVSGNIVYATHEGDVVNTGSTLAEWPTPIAAMDRLNGVLPYGVVAGNHEFYNDYSAANYLTNFGPNAARWIDPNTGLRYSWYGGASPSGLSSYQTFTGGGQNFIALQMVIDAPDSEIAWAQSVIDSHKGTPIIMTTHNWLGSTPAVHDATPYISQYSSNSNESVWQKLVKPNNEIFMVLSGHDWLQNQRVSMNDAGRPVYELICDYQDRPEGGNGWMRTMTFDLDAATVDVNTFSATLNRDMTTADFPGISQFSFAIDLATRFSGAAIPTTAYTWIGTVSGNWNDAANWLNGTTPMPIGAELNFGGTTDYTATNNTASPEQPFTFSVHTLNFTNTGAVTIAGNSANALDLDGTTINKTGSGAVTITAPMTVSGINTANLSSDMTFNSVMSGNGSFIKNGAGSMIFGSSGRFTITGDITINAGTLRDGANDAVGANSIIMVAAGATWDDSFGNGEDFGGIAGEGTVIVKNATGLNFQKNADTLFSGRITGGLNGVIGGDATGRSISYIRKTAGGVSTLNGATSDFAGPVQVYTGTIATNHLVDRNQPSALGMGHIAGAGGIDITLGNSSNVGTIRYTGANTSSNRTFSITGGGGVVEVTDPATTLTLTGVISGAAPFAKSGPGMLALTAANTYSGGTQINGGGITIDHPAVAVLGTGAVSINTGGALSGAGTLANAIRVNGGSLNSTGDGLAVGALTLSGGAIAGNAVTAPSYTIESGMVAANLSGAASLMKSTPGAASILVATSYTGGTSVSGGSLIIDRSGVNNGGIVDGGTLTLGGGAFILAGGDTTDSSLAFAQTQLNAGSSAVQVSTGVDRNATIALGAITRSTGSTLDIVSADNGAGVASITTTTANTNGLLGGYATVGSNWATVNGTGRIVAMSTYNVRNDVAAWQPSDNIANDAAFTGTSGTASINSLRFSAPLAAAVSIDAGQTLTIAGGGLMVAPDVGAFESSIAGGIITSGNSQDLIIHQKNVAGALTIASEIGGNIGLTKVGAGALVLTGLNSYTGPTYIGAGELVISPTGSIASSGSVNVGAAGTLRYAASGTTPAITVDAGGTLAGPANFRVVGGTLSTPLAGPATLTKIDAATLVLSNPANDFSSASIEAGTLRVTAAGALPAGATVTLASGAALDGAAVSMTVGSLAGAGGTVFIGGQRLTVGSNNANTTFAGTISGTGGLTKVGTGRLTLTGAPAFTGTISVSAGGLAIDTGNANFTFTQTINGSGDFIKEGVGTAILSGSSAHLNALTGNIYINAGTLRNAPGNDAVSNSTIVYIAEGAVWDDSYGNGEDHGAIAGAGTVIARAGNSLTFYKNDVDLVFSGKITAGKDGVIGATPAARGTSNVTKANNGRLTLTGSDSDFSGRFSVNGGILSITNIANRNAASALGFGNGTVSGADIAIGTATLEYTGPSASSDRTVSLTGATTIDVTQPATDLTLSGALSGSGSLNKAGSGALTLAGTNTYTGTTTVSSGKLRIASALSGPVLVAAGAQMTQGVAAGGSYAGIHSGAQAGGDLLGTEARILAGANLTSGTKEVTMSWRSLNAQEELGGFLALGDVLDLTGMQNAAGAAQTDPFVLQLSYDPAVTNTDSGLSIGWFNGSAWVNAVDGNSAGIPTFVAGAFSDFGVAGLADDLGRYGLDPAAHTVWAVLDHNSALTVVPEPASLSMLALAAFGLLARRRRRA